MAGTTNPASTVTCPYGSITGNPVPEQSVSARLRGIRCIDLTAKRMVSIKGCAYAIFGRSGVVVFARSNRARRSGPPVNVPRGTRISTQH